MTRIQVNVIIIASAIVWLAFLLVYFRTGTTNPLAVALSSVAAVCVALAYFGVFRIRVLWVMLIAQGLSWNLLPEYSMSFADKIQALWNLNRIGFGGVSAMTFASLLSGIGGAIWPLLRH